MSGKVDRLQEELKIVYARLQKAEEEALQLNQELKRVAITLSWSVQEMKALTAALSWALQNLGEERRHTVAGWVPKLSAVWNHRKHIATSVLQSAVARRGRAPRLEDVPPAMYDDGGVL